MPRFLVTLLSLLALVSFSFTQDQTTSGPQSPPQTVRDPQALSILQQSFAAMGGSSWQSSPAVTLAGTADVYNGQQINGTVSLTASPSGDTSFSVTDDAGNISSFAVTGPSMTVARPQQAQQQVPSHNIFNMPPYFLPALLSSALTDPAYSVSNLGRVSLGSATYLKLEIKQVFSTQQDSSQLLAPLTDRVLYIDPASHLVVRVEYGLCTINDMRVHSTMTIDYASYQQVGNYILPTSISASVQGNLLVHLVINP
jgi:hypothetical protein